MGDALYDLRQTSAGAAGEECSVCNSKLVSMSRYCSSHQSYAKRFAYEKKIANVKKSHYWLGQKSKDQKHKEKKEEEEKALHQACVLAMQSYIEQSANRMIQRQTDRKNVAP